jgi:hypothetical protein
MNRLCWVCKKRPANSREHMVKASDLRLIFGHIDQRSPVWRNTRDERNFAIAGAKSKHMTFEPSIDLH